MPASRVLPGLDLARLAGWLPGALPGAGTDLSGRLIAGGKSNLTYEVTDGMSTWIVRRPPLGHVLATAHDMSREYRVMSVLQSTAVPVPGTLALCQDKQVPGAAFYVMAKVAGTPYRCTAELAELGPERTRILSTGLAGTLATLHAVDPASAGQAGFGKADGFPGRQVGRWKKQLVASYSPDLPAADALHARLAANVPTEPAAGIVHGDYRRDNMLVDDQDRLAAVLDREMATLGDPLTDLAFMLACHRLGSVLPGKIVADTPAAPGFLSEDEIVQRYAATSDRDLAHFGFHPGHAAFKLAAILEGIHFRHLNGQTAGHGFDHIGAAIRPLLDVGLTALKEHG